MTVGALKVLGKSELFKVKAERRALNRRALRFIAAECASGAPAKDIAVETGIVESQIYELRAARRNPHVDTWYALLQRRPDLKPHVERIVSGEATPDQIAELIRYFQRGAR